jgi:GT2 family glycosyltransferase
LLFRSVSGAVNKFVGRRYLINYNYPNGDIQTFPKVSVIVLNLNGLKLLRISIPALIKTNYQNLEIIVIDNGSTDGSIGYLEEEFPSVRVIPLKFNKGITIANNIGARVANGSLLSFINNDMEVDPGWLAPLVEALENDLSVAGCDSKYLNYFDRRRIDFACGAGRFIDKYGNSENRGGNQVDSGQFNNQEEVFHGMAIFRKDLFMKVGGYDEEFFAYFDETDLCWRLHRMGYKILYVPRSIIYHMGGSTSSVPGLKKKMNKNIAFHFHKNRLRMVIKNQFGVSLFHSLFGYAIDTIGLGLNFLLSDNRDYLPVLGMALLWNIRNLRGTLQKKIVFKNESVEFHRLFLPYSGAWRDNIDALASRGKPRVFGNH